MKWLLVIIVVLIVLFGICNIGNNIELLAKPMFFPTSSETVMVMMP